MTNTEARITALVTATGNDPKLYAIKTTAEMIDHDTEAREAGYEADPEMTDHEILVHLDEQVEDETTPFLTEEHRAWCEGRAA